MTEPMQDRAAQLAMEIADYAAPSELESNCVPVKSDGEIWYQLFGLDEDERAELAGVIEYCELRGLLRRNEKDPQLFQVLEP